jgi:hypothetical protein
MAPPQTQILPRHLLDIPELVKRKITDDTGYRHRMITTINFRIKPRTLNDEPHYAWNCTKAKWHTYKEESDSKIPDTQFNFQDEAPDKNCKKFCKLMLHTAKQYIPKGKVPKYKTWSNFLMKLKSDKEMVRKKAELSRDPKDVQT